MGTTDLVARFVQLGNVEHLLLQLEASGLIEERKAAFVQAPDANNPGQGNTVTANGTVVTALSADGRASESSEESAASFYAAPQSGEWAPTVRSELDEAAAAKPGTVTDGVLTQVVDWMATFVLTNMPEKSLTELTAIEKIRTPLQLIADLPRYEASVKQLGPIGAQHIDELSQLIVHLFSTDPQVQTQAATLSLPYR